MEDLLEELRRLSQSDLAAVFLLRAEEEQYFRDNLVEQLPNMAALAHESVTAAAHLEEGDAEVQKLVFADGRRCAAKIFPRSEHTAPPEMLHTIAAAGWPPNIVRYHAILDSPGHRFVLMDDCVGGDFELDNDSDIKFSEDGLRCIVRGALGGLSALHDSQLVHCDIKTGNLLCAQPSIKAFCARSIDAEAQKLLSASVKLVDLSEAHKFGTPRGDLGTVRSPEIWREICECIRSAQGKTWTAEELDETDAFLSLCPAGPAEDLWALGAATYELVANADLFDSDEVSEIVGTGDFEALCRYFEERLAGLPGAFQERGMSAGSASFALHLLRMDPSERPSAKAALEHSWLAIP